jgi:hypothetical protein
MQAHHQPLAQSQTALPFRADFACQELKDTLWALANNTALPLHRFGLKKRDPQEAELVEMNRSVRFFCRNDRQSPPPLVAP